MVLSAAFDESLVKSPRAANIRSHLGITRAAYFQALTLPNPSLFYLRDTAQLARQIGAVVPVEPPWKVAFRVLLARTQVKQTDLEIQRNLWLLRNTVRRAYLDAVIAAETTQTFEELHSITADLLLIAQKRFQAEDVAALDVNRAELAAFQAEADLKQARKKVEQTKQRLSVLMGRDYRTELEVQRVPAFRLKVEANELLPNLSQEFPSLDFLINEALKSRFDLRIAQQSILVNEARLRSTRANILPNPQFDAGYSYSGNPPEGPATRGYFLAVTQPIPIFDFQQGEQARLRAQRVQLKRELEATRNVITEEVVSAYQLLMSARERVGYFQDKILPVSEKVARLSRRAYEVGQNDITSTLAAQQSYIQVKASYLETVRSYQMALTDLEQAVGHPF